VAVRVHGLRPSLVYWIDGERRTWRPLLRATADGFESLRAERGLTLKLCFAAEGPALVVHGTLRNLGADAIRVDHLAPLWLGERGSGEIGPSALDWGIFRNGYQSWTGTRSFGSDDTDRDPWSMLLKVGLIDLRNPSPELPGQFRSDLFGGVENLETGDALVLGFLDGAAAFSGIEIGAAGDVASHLAASVDYDELVLPPGGEISTPPLWMAAGRGAVGLLEQYADASGRTMRARVPARNPQGWCSWYYYFTRIDEACILENLAAVRQLGDRFRCDYVQIDDGYQADIGDWLTPNERFPRGMAYLAEQIRGAGYEAGIWTAPFLARRGSRLFAEHPDWFVKSDRGGPRFALWNPLWGLGNCYALDTTHPEVLDWLRHTFRTIVHEWGYRILKLDFLYAAALPGLRHDRQATRAQALRRGLEAIRAAAGEDVFLLGCGCPLGPAVGLVDAMRIGPDVAPFWSNALSRGAQRDQHGVATKHAVQNTLTRAFLHRRWWLNDPDCLMVRDSRTQLSVEEVRTLATAIAVTDGMIIVSDRMSRLSPQALEILGRTLLLRGGTCRAEDLLRPGLPTVAVSRSEKQTVVAVFNFSDQPERRSVDLHRLALPGAELPYATEFWTAASIPIADGIANFGTLPPHACRVLVLPGA
jgi:alpha-galactosidase